MSKPFVSVLTPVHNTEQYLSRCIESVLGQSFDNWEYLIVNNQCTDGSVSIARSYAAKDRRIRILETDTLLPQQVNYNFALRHISSASKYTKFVQADDWIYPECLNLMVNLAETDHRIAIVSSYRAVGSQVGGQGIVCPDSPNSTFTVMSGRDICRLFFLSEYRTIFGSQTSVLFRSDLIRARDPFFVEASIFGDTEVCLDILDRHWFGFVHQVLSYTRIDNESISSGIQKFHSYELRNYLLAKKYGHRYLSSSEYGENVRKLKGIYYDILAWQLFRRQGPQFWDFHRRCLEQSGEKLDWPRIYLKQIPRLLNRIGNPIATLESIARLFRRGATVSSIKLTDMSANLAPSLAINAQDHRSMTRQN